MLLRGHGSCVTSLEYSSEENFLISWDKSRVLFVWDLTVGTGDSCHLLMEVEDIVCSVSISPGASFILTCMYVYLHTRSHTHTHTPTYIHRYEPYSVKKFLTGDKDHLVCVWDIDTACLVRTLLGHTNWVCSVAWSDDCTYIVSGSEDYSVRVWVMDDTVCDACVCTYVRGRWLIMYVHNLYMHVYMHA